MNQAFLHKNRQFGAADLWTTNSPIKAMGKAL
jgi:hypothetical protein